MAEKFIHINVGAKIPTIVDCVRLKPNQSYSDTITQDTDYNENSGVSLVFKNYCTQSFTVPSIDWFTDTVNGGNFRAYTDSFIITPNQEVSIPLKYEGTYLSDILSHIYQLELNGVTNMFTLTINVPFVNTPPVIQNISLDLDNREEYTFLLTDFTSKFTDIDGDNLDTVKISGTTTNFKLQGVAYVSGTEITSTQISNGLLKYIAPDINTQSSETFTWNATDVNGAISNTANISINASAFCVEPTLVSVEMVDNSTVTYTWDNNGVEYSNLSTMLLEVSTNGGSTYTSLASVSPSLLTYTISSNVVNSISNGSSVKFRVTSNGSACGALPSNVITQTWNKLSEISIENINSSGINSKCFDIVVSYQDFNGKVNLWTAISNNGETQSSILQLLTSSSLVFPETSISANEATPYVQDIQEMIFTIGTHQVCINISGLPNSSDTNSDSLSTYIVEGGFSILTEDNTEIDGTGVYVTETGFEEIV